MIIIKKYFKYFGLIAICMASFFYTEKVALYVKNKNPILQSIREVKESKYQEAINCSIIEDTYIIPGLNGRYINEDASFYNMVTSNYDENLLVFKELKPNISIEDNKDKIIIRGNHNKNAVSIIFENINNLSNYIIQNDFKVNLLIKEEIYNNKYELINNSKNEYIYKKIDTYLKKKKLNNNLCYTNNDKIPKLCKDKYTFTHSLEVNHSNLSSVKNTISSGDIILIKESLTIPELEILINQILYKDLDIIPISELISESN